MSFRGYDVSDYEIALQAVVEVGLAELGGRPGVFPLSRRGRQLGEQTEQLTKEYFYAPWSVLLPEELDELCDSLTKLRSGLHAHKKSSSRAF